MQSRMKAYTFLSYSSFVISPLRYALLLAFTSAVWGNEPMVVVGREGSPSISLCMPSLSFLSGSLVKSLSLKASTASLTSCIFPANVSSKATLFLTYAGSISGSFFSASSAASRSSFSFSSANDKPFLISSGILSSYFSV